MPRPAAKERSARLSSVQQCPLWGLQPGASPLLALGDNRDRHGRSPPGPGWPSKKLRTALHVPRNSRAASDTPTCRLWYLRMRTGTAASAPPCVARGTAGRSSVSSATERAEIGMRRAVIDRVERATIGGMRRGRAGARRLAGGGDGRAERAGIGGMRRAAR